MSYITKLENISHLSMCLTPLDCQIWLFEEVS